MKIDTREYRCIGILAAALILLCVTGYAQAQAGTRTTPCNAATPDNAICIDGVAPETHTNGAPIVLPITYRVEQRIGSGAWVAIGGTLNAPRLYVQNLAPATYTFRMYAIVATVQSAASNEAGKSVVQLPPNAPIITIAVVIGVGHAPVYRIVSGNQRSDGVLGFVPVGRACTGAVAFRYRGLNFRRVAVKREELWGTTDTRNLAAPCA